MTPSKDQDYTRDELAFLSELRRKEGRTCRHCSWLSVRGNQRGCFPEGKYRKFLSKVEYESGCLQFVPRKDKSAQ